MFDMNDIKRNVGKLAGGDKEITDQDASRATERSSSRARSKSPATIGPSIRIKGDVTGEEDLIIEGCVDGEVTVKNNDVTIGRNGKVNAHVYAKSISVEGELQGDLIGEERVVIRNTGNVQGNIVAPRVSLEEGAKFKGSIDMDPKNAGASKPKSSGADISKINQA